MDKETRRLLMRGVLFEKWVIAKQNNDNLADIFKRMGYHKIAIYGMGDIGFLLLNELTDSDIEVPYVIDKGFAYSFKPVKSFEDEWENVDAIVVTLPHIYDSVKKEIEQKCDYPVLSLTDILAWG